MNNRFLGWFSLSIGLVLLVGFSIKWGGGTNGLLAQVGGSGKAGECGGTVECFCGDTVVADYTMTRDLQNRKGGTICEGTGLILGKKVDGQRNPTLNCARFNIAGT